MARDCGWRGLLRVTIHGNTNFTWRVALMAYAPSRWRCRRAVSRNAAAALRARLETRSAASTCSCQPRALVRRAIEPARAAHTIPCVSPAIPTSSRPIPPREHVYMRTALRTERLSVPDPSASPARAPPIRTDICFARSDVRRLRRSWRALATPPPILGYATADAITLSAVRPSTLISGGLSPTAHHRAACTTSRRRWSR